MNKKFILISLMLYKFVLMNIALFVLAKSMLMGDNLGYTNMGFFFDPSQPQRIISYSTYLTQYAVWLLKFVFFNSSYLTNLFFNLLSFFGIALALSKIKLEKNLTSYLFILVLFLPSFNLWSSFTGKEAIMVFLSGLVIRLICPFFENGTAPAFKIPISEPPKQKVVFIGVALLFALVIFYKPLFMVFIFPLLVLVLLQANTSWALPRRTLFFWLTIIALVIACFFLRDKIDSFTLKITEAFSGPSTKSNRASIWTYHYAYFYTLPYSMFLSLWGTLYSEINSAPKLLSFVESVILFACYFGFFLIFMINSIRYGLRWIPTSILIALILLCISSLTFMGVINPGSTIRYRTNNYLYLLVFFYYLSKAHIDYAGSKEVITSRQFST